MSMSLQATEMGLAAHQIGGLVMTLLGHCRSEIGMGLKGTYFSPAVGIMGFWGDIERLLAPRTAKRPLANTAMETEGVAATGGRIETNDKRSAGPRARGGGSANKSKRRQSQHGRQNRALPAGVNPPDGGPSGGS